MHPQVTILAIETGAGAIAFGFAGAASVAGGAQLDCHGWWSLLLGLVVVHAWFIFIVGCVKLCWLHYCLDSVLKYCAMNDEVPFSANRKQENGILLLLPNSESVSLS